MVPLLSCAALILILLIVGMVYQSVGALIDRKRFLTWGRLVDIGDGQKLYLFEKGSGGPAVIFESGISATSQNWLHVQESVSAFARVIAYDRGGLGWSTPCASERTPSNLSRELQAMLQNAGIEPPYVLVGHSFGGLVVRRYSADYPEVVAGVVLVDAMRTEEWPPVNEKQRAFLERGTRLTRFAVTIARLGLARLAVTSMLCGSGRISGALSRAAGSDGEHVLKRITCEVGKMPRLVRPIVAAHWSRPSFYRGMVAHLKAVPESVKEMHCAEPIGEAPVVLLTPGSAQPLSSDGLQRIGLNVRQVIAEKSGHWIHLDEPELVVDAIRMMVEQCRMQMAQDSQSVLV